MNKTTIIRYLKGELTNGEELALFDWIESSQSNRRYFNSVKNLWVASGQDISHDVHPDYADLRARINRSQNKPSKWKRVVRYTSYAAAILFIPIAAAFIWLTAERSSFQPLEQGDYPLISHYTPLSVRSEIILPDGTEVWLNAGSRISYPRYFSGGQREVTLDGEAYFAVVSNQSHPFSVKTPAEVEILVTGTSFNVCAYSEDPNAEVTLVTGSVELRGEESGESIKMKPNQLAKYDVNSREYVVHENVDATVYTSWKDGVLAFENATMDDLARRIERWYSVRIIIEDPEIRNYTFTGRFREENIIQILELIRETTRVDYLMEEKVVYLKLRE